MAFVNSTRSAGVLCSVLAVLSLAKTGCSADGAVPDGNENVDSASAELGWHVEPQSAETVVTTVNPANWQLVMSYNDDDPGFVVHASGTRFINRNASLMGFTGWNFVLFSPTHTGKVRPPTNWSVLWGDPAITRNRANANQIYLTQLAIPTNKFPSSGQIVGPVTTNTPANFCGAFVGGACIARSTDAGNTFTLASSDCVRRTSTECPFGTFYDGSDIETSPAGRVFAAYNDVKRSRIDVYMALSGTGSFARVTDFNSTATMHPRLKWGPGGLYLLVESGGTLKLARYGDGTTRTGTWTTPVNVATGVVRSDVVLSDRRIRLGPQYAFDIGKNENGTDEVRILFTVVDTAGKKHIRGAKCTTGSPITCSQPSTWNTGSFRAGGDQWNPVIAYGARTNGTHVWGISFWDRANFPTGNQVELFSGIITSIPGQSSMVVSPMEAAQRPCSDQRGYWGDYDNLAYFPTLSVFYRGFSDSSHADPCVRGPFSGVYNAALATTSFGL